jgi:hypothetical protein
VIWDAANWVIPTQKITLVNLTRFDPAKPMIQLANIDWSPRLHHPIGLGIDIKISRSRDNRIKEDK